MKAEQQKQSRDYREHHPNPENIFWLIENSDSSLNKDLEIKSKVYAAASIPDYWVINLRIMQLNVLRRSTRKAINQKKL